MWSLTRNIDSYHRCPHRRPSREARQLLESWLERPRMRAARTKKGTADLVVEQGSLRLAVELKGAGDSAAVGTAITAAKVGASRIGPKVLPVIAVPYMGDVGKKLCAEAGICVVRPFRKRSHHRSGAAHPDQGRPNRFVRRGRPASVFAPKSARIARRLLIDPHRAWRQQDLARTTDSTTASRAESSSASRTTAWSSGPPRERFASATPTCCSTHGARCTTSRSTPSYEATFRLATERSSSERLPGRWRGRFDTRRQASPQRTCIPSSRRSAWRRSTWIAALPNRSQDARLPRGGPRGERLARHPQRRRRVRRR